MFYKKRIEELKKRLDRQDDKIDYLECENNKPKLEVGKDVFIKKSIHTPSFDGPCKLLELKIVKEENLEYFSIFSHSNYITRWVGICLYENKVIEYPAYMLTHKLIKPKVKL